MGEVKWVKMSIDMFDNRKIKYLRGLPEGNNIVLIWVMLLTLAGRCNSNGIYFSFTETSPYTPAMLANELGFPRSTILVAMKALESMGNDKPKTRKNTLLIPGWGRTSERSRVGTDPGEQPEAAGAVQGTGENRSCGAGNTTAGRGEARGTRRTRRTEAVEKAENQRSKDSFRAVVEPVSEQKGKGQVSDTDKEKTA